MSLVADYGSDSDESDVSEKDIKIKPEPSSSSEEETVNEKKPLPNVKLPPPLFSKTPPDAHSSVFVNRYLEAENAEAAILQKHVKMISAHDPVLINGKKICWNHRKGRCRFGHQCKFAHDSDLRKSADQLSNETEQARAESVICHFEGTNHGVPIGGKRKRPGLSQNLVPGKKVMKQYLMNKS
ncbi:unnamed protein product [Ceutorhynchus assimilis]|uniref:C3H1-type domain-containing protein n=1 Tax=Ceutorhynchus assimilis TaxID=467358 RepID=A0A9N9QML0_9CUCU|nr:unnamed protein product [Ceutorhynchus assimilis]